MEGSWAQAEWDGIEIWDRRCVGSLIRITEHLTARPEEAFSAAAGSAGRQAAHRIFTHPTTTVAGLLAGHRDQTAKRCLGHPVVLAVQDTTELDFTRHKASRGLGPIGQGKQRGLLAHSVLVVTPAGLPLGLLDVAIWARDPEEPGKAASRRRRRTAEKESRKWLAGLAAVEAALPPEQPVVVVADREADVFAYLAAPRRAHTDLVLRVCQARVVEVATTPGAAERLDLPTAARSAPIVGELTVRVPRQPGHPEREAHLIVRATPVMVQPPRHRLAGEPDQPQAVSLVHAAELSPPAGETPIDWLLLTTLAIPDEATACLVVRYYARRWEIERFHYTLKSGCQVERLQFDTAERLAKGLAVYCLVAWRLLWLTHVGRTEPERPAADLLGSVELTVLAASARQAVGTARAAVRAIAKLGGFEGAPSAGEPGVKSLWRGLRRLEAMVEGWQLAHGLGVTRDRGEHELSLFLNYDTR